MFRLQNVSGSIETTDAIEEEAKNIAEDFDVSEDNVVMNNSYLLANYVDPASYAGIACIILVDGGKTGILTILQHLLTLRYSQSTGIRASESDRGNEAPDPARWYSGKGFL